MCNPRRVQITATRQLREAWESEVSRRVALRGRVAGEARVRQALDATLSAPVLRALELAMSNPESGWEQSGDGYRFAVDGGYVLYLPDEAALEIVARLEDEVEAEATAVDTLRGEVEAELSAIGTGNYYDDGYGGRTESVARKAAEDAAQQAMEKERAQHLKDATERAEAGKAAEIEATARQRAEEKLRAEEARRQAELERQAADRLQTVGLRGRQAFHRILASAYRDALLGFARLNGAEGIQCREEGDTVEIEFRVRR